MKEKKGHRVEHYFTALNQTNMIATNIFSDHQGGIQTNNQCRLCSINFQKLPSKDQDEELPRTASHIEIQTGVIKFLLQEAQVLTRLVQSLDSKKPMPLRTYPPRLVDSLICQSQTIINFLSKHVAPHYEKIDNNKK